MEQMTLVLGALLSTEGYVSASLVSTLLMPSPTSGWGMTTKHISKQI